MHTTNGRATQHNPHVGGGRGGPLRRDRRSLAGAVCGLGLVAAVLTGCTGEAPGAASTPPASSTPTPTPTPTPTAAASIAPLKQPAKPFPLPTMPTTPAKADELGAIKHALQRVVWASVGEVDKKTSTKCDTTNDKLVAEDAELSFDCVVSASGVKTTFAVKSETGAESIDWSFKVAELPLTQRKVEFEMARQAYKPARVTCDVDGTELVPVGDADAITCWVTQTNNTSVVYHGGLDDSGVITFVLAPTARPTPTPTPTPTAKSRATPAPSSSNKPSPSASSSRKATSTATPSPTASRSTSR